VRADGRKELIAIAEGYRESAESWADLLHDCARRGMRAPVLAIGDGAAGFFDPAAIGDTHQCRGSAPCNLNRRRKAGSLPDVRHARTDDHLLAKRRIHPR